MKKLFLAILFLLGLAALGYWWMATYNLVDDAPVQTEINAVQKTVSDYIDNATTKTLEVSFETKSFDTLPNHDVFSLPLADYTPSDSPLDGVEKTENIFPLNAPFSAVLYDQSYASTFLYSLEILKDNKRHALYTEISSRVDSSTLSPDKTRLFIANAVEKNGEWFQVHRIITIDSKKTVELPALDCVSEHGYWQGPKTLITYGATPEDGGRQKTPVCVWSTNGSLVAKMDAALYWGTDASAPYLYDAIGVLPNNENMIWLYARSREDACSLYLYNTDTLELDIQKDIPDALNADEENNNRCKPAQFNFSDYDGSVESIDVRFVEVDSPLDAIQSNSLE
jgi:hypothetical protein